MRKAGILMPVASISSNHGIGDFGKKSYEFIDLTKKAGFKIWQILPLNPLGFGNSPYQPYSSFAMDALYISLDELVEKGYLTSVPTYKMNAKQIDYEGVRLFKEKYLRKAFSKFKKDRGYNMFVKQPWVYPYAVFATFKKINHMQCWNLWPDSFKLWIDHQDQDLSAYQEEIDYELFIQYTLYRQWINLKKYANKKGIEIMGDIPIYVGIDSLDVWSYQKGFLLDGDGHPTFIAGVPPDYFSADGQRWGNPIYDWKQLEEDKFDFWINRLDYSMQLFDVVRIDHFRAFDTYWKIKASCSTAIDGEWVEAPGYGLFDRLFEVNPKLRLVAEDLGYLRDEVLQLRDHYHLMGMRVIQYSFDPVLQMEDKEHLLTYTGTHDNEPLKTWYKALDKSYKKQVTTFFKNNALFHESPIDNIIQYALNTKSTIVIIPMVDLLHKDNECRLNTPGTVGGNNWRWRLKDLQEYQHVINKIHKMIKDSKR